MTYEEALRILKQFAEESSLDDYEAEAFKLAEHCIMICDQLKNISILVNSR